MLNVTFERQGHDSVAIRVCRDPGNIKSDFC